MASTDNPSTDLLLHILDLEGHYELMTWLNLHAMNLKISGQTAQYINHNNSLDVHSSGKGQHYYTNWRHCTQDPRDTGMSVSISYVPYRKLHNG